MPVNPKAKLVENLFADDIEQKPTRDGFGAGLVEAGKRNEQVVALCADLSESTRMLEFKKVFPERFVQVGVAEQNLATVATGMALMGKIPFFSSYASFSPGRNWEQIRTTIALNNTNSKVVGSHAGVSVGPDGATHQMLEDIAMMRAMPNMKVFYPSDMNEAKKATMALAEFYGPAYLRLAREKTQIFTTEKTPFEVGKGLTLWDPSTGSGQVAIIGAGPLTYQALLAADTLEKEKISVRVINMASIKPLDDELVLAAAKQTGAVVTVEEAQIAGGLGGAVAEFLSENYPVPIKRVGMRDRFGESGDPAELIEKFELTAPFIIKAVKAAINMKGGKK